MFLIKIYLFLSIVMVLVVLWDFKTVPKTASRFTKKVGDKETDLALIVLAIRNLTFMAMLAFFVWPVIIWVETVSDKDKR